MKSVGFLLILLLPFTYLSAQEDTSSLLSSIEGGDSGPNYTTASFKSNRIINLHSIENTAPGVLDFTISHRFGSVKNGVYDIFGLDAAQMRLGFDFGLSDRLAVGVGRSNNQKIIDGYAKYKVLRQRNPKGEMPVSLSVVLGMGMSTQRFSDPNRNNLFSSRLYYNSQLLLARKFSEGFTLQLTPTWIHRNLVATSAETNDVIAFGVGARQKITKRLSLNAEFIYVLPDQLGSQYTNSASIGVDIETGGHVFQLHFTNSQGMNEKTFVTETSDKWSDFAVHFGFNLSRVFTLWSPAGASQW